MINVKDILKSLALQRMLFHSEADFQHAFAWEIHKRLPSDACIRLEMPFPAKNKLRLDVWVKHNESILVIELKYKTRALSVRVQNEQFNLASQSAQDIGRYDFIKDIQRLELVTGEQKNAIGYAILLTNDSSYWTSARDRNTVDADFRLEQDRHLYGGLKWGAGASPGTKQGREAPLTLHGSYIINWEDFPQPSQASYGTFRYLVVEVKGQT